MHYVKMCTKNTLPLLGAVTREIRGETVFQRELYFSVVLVELLFIKRFSDKEETWLSRTKTICSSITITVTINVS